MIMKKFHFCPDSLKHPWENNQRALFRSGNIDVVVMREAQDLSLFPMRNVANDINQRLFDKDTGHKSSEH